MKLNINVCVGKENKVSKSTADPTASLMYSRIKKKTIKQRIITYKFSVNYQIKGSSIFLNSQDL